MNREPHHGNFGQPPKFTHLQPKTPTAGKALLAQFANAHALADSVVKLVINDMSAYASLNIEYGFLYPNWEKHLNDTLTGPALEYRFYYGLLYHDDTIQSANVRVGADMRINSCEIYELIAYKQFLNGQLQVGPTDALTKATSYDIKKKDVSITFHTTNYSLDTLSDFQQVKALYAHATADPGGFFWQIDNECDGCVTLRVDATKGKVFGKGFIRTVY